MDYVIHPAMVPVVQSDPIACGISAGDRVWSMEKVGGELQPVHIPLFAEKVTEDSQQSSQ